MNTWLDADWPAIPGVCALTTVRHGLGVSSPPFDHFNLGARCGDDPQTVVQNRHALIETLQLPSAPCWLRQVHGIEVARWEHVPATADEPEVDASVTSVPGVVLAILTADCLPVVLASRTGDEIAAAHAGWPGLSSGMIEATVRAMRTAPAELIAWLGPAAGPQRYEIGAEVRQKFLALDRALEFAFVPTRPGHWRVDLFAIARKRLAAVGVTQVHGGGVCTIGDPQRFFSHRRDQVSGRMATLVWMQP